MYYMLRGFICNFQVFVTDIFREPNEFCHGFMFLVIRHLIVEHVSVCKWCCILVAVSYSCCCENWLGFNAID